MTTPESESILPPEPAYAGGTLAPSAETHDSHYKVSLDVFEGPLDLLLYLIKQDEIDIYDIRIERITSQYMSYLDAIRTLNISLAGEFLVMAANLCYLKSRMMLPKHVQPPEEEAEEEDPRWDLIRQLIEYKKFKEAARELGEKEAIRQNQFTHSPDPIQSDEEGERPLDEGVGIFDLIRAFQKVLDRLKTGEGLGEIVDDRYTVADKIELLQQLLAPGSTYPFTALFDDATTKHEMIVTFLAVLELMKLNVLQTRQERVLGEIVIYRPAS